jgi:hypothetical protein
MPGLAAVNDVLNFLGRIHLLLYPSPPNQDEEEYYDEEYEEREDTPTKQLIDVHKDDNKDDKDSHINAIKLPTDTSTLSRCVLDSGANRHIFNDETWLEGTNSPPLTPTSTLINGISGSIKASHQCVIGKQATFICPSAKDNVLALGWLSQFPTILTTFSSVSNSFRISFGVHIFDVPMTSDSLYYISKEQVKLILTHVNNVTTNVKANVSKAYSKEQLTRAHEVRRLHYALLHPADAVLI